MARRYSIKERQSYCDKWRSSELSKIKFCKEEKISESALHKWLKLYVVPSRQAEQKEADIKFIRPEFGSETEEGKTIDILLPNGIQIKAEVKSVVEIIRELLL